MKRTALKRVGKVGRANAQANKRLREKLGDIHACEIRLEGCMVTWPLQFVHRHKRAWYKGDVERLSDVRQVVIGCQVCHDRIEHDSKLTEEVFTRLRGKE